MLLYDAQKRANSNPSERWWIILAGLVELVVLEELAVHLEVSQAVTLNQRRALAHEKKKKFNLKFNKCPLAYSFYDRVLTQLELG